MSIDRRQAMRLRLPSRVLTVDRDRLTAFACAIGETNPIYSDIAAAQQSGHRDLPVPPTYFFSLEMEGPDAFGYLTALGVDMHSVLHGGQTFDYHGMAYAGETLGLRSRIVDVYSKRGGALEFVVKKTDFTRGRALIAESAATMVVRHTPELGG